jgi:murein DD-endopeptidase MepM/ murein hydrolase activator NlpD
VILDPHIRRNGAPAVRPWICPLPKLESEPRVLSSSGRRIVLGYGTEVAASERFVPVFAAHDGAIVFAAKATTGYSLSIDHAGGWSTHYGDLEHMLTLSTDRFRNRRKERVRAGDIIGYSGRDPVRVSFEIWRTTDDGREPVAPAEHLRQFLVLPWSDPTQSKRPVAKRRAA